MATPAGPNILLVSTTLDETPDNMSMFLLLMFYEVQQNLGVLAKCTIFYGKRRL